MQPQGRQNISAPLQLGADRSGWRVHGLADHADRGLISASVHVLRRAQYTCAYCGFRSAPDRESVPDPGAVETNSRACGYLQVHPRHGNHRQWRLEDLVAVCPFCHETLHCGAGGAQDSGLIVACPWIEQRDLCLLCNAMAVASAAGDGTATAVDQLWGQLERLQGPAQEMFGVQRLSCGLLGAGLLALRDMAQPLYEQRGRALQGLRYIPDRRVFAQAIAYWSVASWRPLSEWQEVHSRWLRRRPS
jgi:hypothetical protein